VEAPEEPPISNSKIVCHVSQVTQKNLGPLTTES